MNDQENSDTEKSGTEKSGTERNSDTEKSGTEKSGTERNSDTHNKQEPQAPKFMQPRKPVFDEPLEEVEPDPQEETEARQPVPVKTPTTEQPSLEATQELKSEPESSEQNGPISDELISSETDVHSPYFPRGIYEDARSVEAYYGRGDDDLAAEPLPEKGIKPDEASARSLKRWLILIFAILMILVLLFLTLTQGIPLGFF